MRIALIGGSWALWAVAILLATAGTGKEWKSKASVGTAVALASAITLLVVFLPVISWDHWRWVATLVLVALFDIVNRKTKEACLNCPKQPLLWRIWPLQYVAIFATGTVVWLSSLWWH